MAKKNATQVSLLVQGINKTGAVFGEIARSAARVGKTAALFGAAAAAGASAAFLATARSLGSLSDVAMRASASTDELSKMATAMNVLGVKAQTPEALAAAFQKMTKATGETGVEGFKKCAAAIAEMETAEERSAAAMAVFGKSGLDFLPVIEGIRLNGVSALEDVMAAMPGISQAAADAGDAIADSMVIMTEGAKSLWSDACGAVAKALDESFEGGARQAALNAVAYVEYFSKMAARYAAAFAKDWTGALSNFFEAAVWAFESLMRYIGDIAKVGGKMFVDAFVGTAKNLWNGGEIDMSVEAMFERAGGNDANKLLAERMRGAMHMAGETFASVVTDDLKAKLEDKLEKAAKAAAAVSSAAVAVGAAKSAEDASEKVRTAVRAARNEFMLADSYKAVTMSLRSDYGKGDRTTAAVNAVKAVNEKILVATEKTASALDKVEVA